MKTQGKDYMQAPLLRAFGRLRREPASELTVLTWNVEQEETHPEPIVEALLGPLKADLYVLQEVDRHTRRSGYQDLPGKIAWRLHVDYVFGSEFEELAQGGAFDLPLRGEVIFSRLPILHARILRFHHQPHNWGGWWKPRVAFFQPRRGGRLALVAELEWGDSNLVLYNTCLEGHATDDDRAQQMSEILDDLWLHYSPEKPAIIAGDFNTKEGNLSAVIRLLQAEAFRDLLEKVPEPHHVSAEHEQRLGGMFGRNLESLDARIHRPDVLGHYPVSSTISLVRNFELSPDSNLAGELHRRNRENHQDRKCHVFSPYFEERTKAAQRESRSHDHRTSKI